MRRCIFHRMLFLFLIVNFLTEVFVCFYMFIVCRLSVVVPALAETEACRSDEDLKTTLSQYVDASLCIHWSLVFFHQYMSNQMTTVNT